MAWLSRRLQSCFPTVDAVESDSLTTTGCGWEPPGRGCCLRETRVGNVADDGGGDGAGGAYWGDGYMTLTGCTFARNGCDGEDLGGAIYLGPSHPGTTTMLNCILWDNWTETSNTTPDNEADQILLAAGTAVAYYSCCQLRITDPDNIFSDLSNIGSDPLFTDPTSLDFLLDANNCGDDSCDSLAIDRGAGHSGQPICDGQYDVGGVAAGRDRCVPLDMLDEDIDMGALETQEVPD